MCIPPKIPNSKKWKKILIEEYGFEYLEDLKKLPLNVIWTTSCSKTKNNGNIGVPKDFYLGKTNKIFYKYVEKAGLKYGVLSDKYGIHMSNEKLDYYDIHPSNLSDIDKRILGSKIQEKIEKYKFDGLVFYYPSPLLSKPYFEILWHIDVPVYYLTKIKLLDE